LPLYYFTTRVSLRRWLSNGGTEIVFPLDANGTAIVALLLAGGCTPPTMRPMPKRSQYVAQLTDVTIYNLQNEVVSSNATGVLVEKKTHNSFDTACT